MSIVCSAEVTSACDDLEIELEKQKIELESIHQSRLNIDRLLSAKLNIHLSLANLVSLSLAEDFQVQKELENVIRQQKQLGEDLELPKKWAICDKKELWLELAKTKRSEQKALLTSKQVLLSLPRNIRNVLDRELNSWSRLSMSYQNLFSIELTSILDDDHRASHSLFISESLEYKKHLESFLSLLLEKDSLETEINRFWLSLMEVKKEQNRPSSGDSNLDSGFDTLINAKQTLLLDVNEWRNSSVMSAGWIAFFNALLQPTIFIDSLVFELKSAPQNFIDNLSNPFIREYLSSEKESKGAQVLTSWTIQFAFLLLMIFALIKSATNAAAWLAEIQQMLFKRLESATAHSLLSGIFWMLKPNASWVFILVVANVASIILPDSWQIIKLIAPIATIYAGFRALRIIIEWGLSRTYTRGGMFLSNHTAEQLILDSRKMTWVMVYASALWGLVYATGSAYLTYVLSLVYLAMLWSGAWWIMRKHDVAVNKLIHLVLNIKLDAKKEDQKHLFIILNKVARPLVFVFVHILDVLSSLNQKMMVFDVYRSFSVKLLRVRLESKTEESSEDDEGEPDQNYSDWMLRDAPEGLLFDVGDVTNLIDPLSNWFSDKTDENIMVIVGESGSGKSTLVRRLPNLWKECPVKVLDIPPKVTDPQMLFDSIAKVLGVEAFTEVGGLVRQDAELEQQVIVIDSAHNLFLAEVGLFDAYKSLLQCMNAHLENVFWVVVMHAPSWTYLNYVFVREQRISNIYKMPRWSPMDIRKLILSRHQGGRRRLKYNEMLLSAAASSESSSVRAADSRVFNILWEQCGGNPLAAIELWLYAVKVKGRMAEVGVPQRPSANLLNGLKDDLYFVYTAIVQHSSLSTDEIMLVTHFSEPVVRHALKQGINLGMITRDDTKRYMVDPYWYGSLSGFLHRKNMLWG